MWTVESGYFPIRWRCKIISSLYSRHGDQSKRSCCDFKPRNMCSVKRSCVYSTFKLCQTTFRNSEGSHGVRRTDCFIWTSSSVQNKQSDLFLSFFVCSASTVAYILQTIKRTICTSRKQIASRCSTRIQTCRQWIGYYACPIEQYLERSPWH